MINRGNWYSKIRKDILCHAEVLNSKLRITNISKGANLNNEMAKQEAKIAKVA